MKQVPVSLWILMASLIALGAFLFLDLKKKTEPVVWDLNLQTIRYNGISFEKQSSFKGDTYYTSFQQDGTSYRYRASTTVPNLFQDFEELKMHGLYALEGELRKRFPEQLFGQNEETICVELVPRSESAFKLCALEEDRNGKLFAVADRAPNEGEVYLVAKYTMDRLKSEKTSFLERRAFPYPTASSTMEMKVTMIDTLEGLESSEAGENGAQSGLDQSLPFTVHLFRREKQQEQTERTMMVWKNEAGAEAAAEFANPLDTVIRQFQIKFFTFEYDQDPETLWKSARPVFKATMVAGVDGKKMENFEVEVRIPAEPLLIQDTPLVLISSPSLDGIQVMERSTLERALNYMRGLHSKQNQPGMDQPVSIFEERSLPLPRLAGL